MIGTFIALAAAGGLALYALSQGSSGSSLGELAAGVQGWLNSCRAGRPNSPALLVLEADPTRAPALEREIPPGYDGLVIVTPGDWLLYHIQGGKRVYTTVNHWQVLYARGDCPPEIAPELYGGGA